MLQLGLYCDDGFDDYFLDLLPYGLAGLAEGALLSVAEHAATLTQTARQPQLVLVPVEVVVLLVEAVVGQVHEQVLYVHLRADAVLLGGQPHDPVLVEEYGEGVDDRGHQHVDAKVKLVPVNQRWLLYVLLDHVGVVFLND